MSEVGPLAPSGDALVVGESLIDTVTTADGLTREHPGGSPANVAVALARLGRPVRFATAFGADPRGEVLAQHLTDAGVGLAGEPRVLPRTSVARASIGADGAASYEFDVDWRPGPIEVGGPRVVHVGSIGAVLAPGNEAVLSMLAALAPSVLVTYDVNARPAITGTGPQLVDRVERVARFADVVKVSDEDLALLHPGLDPIAAAHRLLDLGPRAVALTEGGAGARWITREQTIRVAAEPVVVVDTIGAGDTFAAALIDALWDDADRDPREVLLHAVGAAAVTVSRPGADPPYRDEISSPGGTQNAATGRHPA